MEPTAPGFLTVKPCVNAGKLKSFPGRNRGVFDVC
jgi:hypothetical protein